MKELEEQHNRDCKIINIYSERKKMHGYRM